MEVGQRVAARRRRRRSRVALDSLGHCRLDNIGCPQQSRAERDEHAGRKDRQGSQLQLRLGMSQQQQRSHRRNKEQPTRQGLQYVYRSGARFARTEALQDAPRPGAAVRCIT